MIIFIVDKHFHFLCLSQRIYCGKSALTKAVKKGVWMFNYIFAEPLLLNSQLVLTSSRNFSKATRWIINERVVSQSALTSPITIKTCRASKYLLHVIMHRKRPAGKGDAQIFFLVRGYASLAQSITRKESVGPAASDAYARGGREHQQQKKSSDFDECVGGARYHAYMM